MLLCLCKQKELSADSSFLLGKSPMAEKVGFEPTSHFRDYLISSDWLERIGEAFYGRSRPLNMPKNPCIMRV